MTARNIILTGVPRGGTTLGCHLLHSCVDTIALVEPMDVTRLPLAPAAALDHIDAFFSATRSRVLSDGAAPSMHIQGQVPDNPFGDATDSAGRRTLLLDHGDIAVRPPGPGFTLVVKHNAVFAALLPGLAHRFETYAIVRNPLSVLASWNTVDLPVAHGRLPAGERLDPDLARRLDADSDTLSRQITILRWFFARFRTFLAFDRVLRYEDIVTSQGHKLRQAVGLIAESRPALETRNASALYRRVDAAGLADVLRNTADPAWSPWYQDCDIEDTVAAMLNRP